MQTVVSPSTQTKQPLPDPVLHRAFCCESPYAVAIADRDGRTIEWNRMAERLTGISREDAIATAVWDLFGRNAPARIPYEVAVEAGRSTFRDLMGAALKNASGGGSDAGTAAGLPSGLPVRRRDGLILSTTGQLLRMTVDFFPFWVGDVPAFAVCATRAEPA